MWWIRVIMNFLRTLLRARAEPATEDFAPRQRLAILELASKRPRRRKRDRVSWVWLCRFWAEWQSNLVIVKPESVKRELPLRLARNDTPPGRPAVIRAEEGRGYVPPTAGYPTSTR